MLSKFLHWFDERWPFRQVIRYSLKEEIPGGDSFWYCFGAVTLFVFVLQVLTGIWQLFFYVPTVDHAYQSVSYIRQQVPFGWFIHGLHYWGSNLFIVLVIIHMLRVFVWGAYKYPRQLTWLAGVLLLFLVLALSFTGALLPWDELGYWAAEVGTSIAGTVPVIGFYIKEFLRGGAAMDQATLSRFFVLHIAILPGILGGLIAFHVVAFRQFKSVGPWDLEKSKKIGYFWPNQVLKDMIAVSFLFIVLVGLIVFWRAPVTGPADPIDSSITPKPEWQFLFLYQFLKLFKGPWEPVGTVGVPSLLFLILFLLPFYDRGKHRNPFHRPFAMLGCIALLTWFIVYTILGYQSQPGANLTAPVSVSSKASASVKAGAKLFSAQGCLACHTIGGKGGNVGPNLSNEGTKGHSGDWLRTQIRNPKAHDSSTAMPSFSSLSDKQINNLVDFLQSQGSSSQKASQSSGASKQSSQNDPPPQASAAGGSDPNAGSKTDTPANKPGTASPQNQQANPDTSLISRGKSLFDSQSCLGCHTINGKGGSVGPNLSAIGSTGHSQQWLTVQLKNPKEHNATTIMPSFSSLSNDKIKALVAYLESLKSTTTSTKNTASDSNSIKPNETNESQKPTEFNQPAQSTELNNPSTSSASPSSAVDSFSKVSPAAYFVGNPSHGEELFKKQCQRCHGKDAKGGVPNPGSDDGTVPPLNPIDPTLSNPNPITFAENIDRFMQHGSIPAGPHPEKHMPAFGDDLKLTQPMMAQIQAYILKLNNVDRAKILNPGIKPDTFFVITILVYALAVTVTVFVAFWIKARLPEPEQSSHDDTQGPSASAETAALSQPDDASGSGEEQKQAAYQTADGHRSNSIAFAILVIVLIVIIATCVLLVFSSFVTTKPIPSITTQKIISGQSDISDQPKKPADHTNISSDETSDNANTKAK